MPTSSISINWNNIREHNGSSNNGFEELVCQLAHVHTVNDATFIRIGTPDGGVEAYWQFQDGSEYGWQAKYFTSWDNSKWPQIKESLATAVKTHPKLTRYYICTPLDRPDARIPRKKSAMDHWNELVSYSKTLKNEIELVYWGNHELVELLSQPTNSGLRYYWFYQDDLSLQWFSAHIDRSICDLGPRYTPAVNVRQEISQYFDSLRQNDCCYNLQDKHLDTFLNVVNKSIRYYFEVDGSSCVSELRGYLDAIILSYHRKAVSSQMDEVKLTEAINNIRTWLHRNIEILSNHSETSSNNDSINSEKSRIETSLRLLQEIQQALWDFESFIDSSHVKCFNNPSVLLYGDAGSGKSHLLADIATQCLAEEVPCILLLGQQFVATDSPWHQIINSHLRLSCSNEATLLGAINALGMLRNQRILFMIDAINEGAGRKYWPNYLAGFIHEFKKYPYISLVITLRSSYLECFNNEIRDSLYRIEHRGFEDDYLFDAMNVFFRYYDIEQPNVPLLNPEFYNPLFLKLFCSGLQKAGHHSIPKGMLGLKAIFDFFVKTSADAIYHRNNLDQKLKIVPLIIESFAQYTIEKSKNFIPYTDAAKIINSIVMPFGINSPNLLQELIAEGIFSADISYDESWNPLDVVRFSYERLENLIKVQMLLSDVSKDDLKNTFSEKGILFTYMNDTGMLETFSIIIPEKYHCELYSVIDDKTIHPAKIAKAFLYSLLWRNGDSININKGKEYLNTVILRYQSTFSLFIETIYAVATDANHPYNANLLHEWLSKHKLATRDSFWSTHIATHYYPEGNISRLIDWCRYHANNIDFSDQSRLLAGTALSWLFTATNNPLRDNATLALTRLLINHLDIAKELLIKFKNIDDPYVMERIWAAVYGATLNSPEHLDIKALSQWIIDDFFSQEEVYPHILVRDYARNIVEYACLNGKFFLPDKSIIRPPYKSIFPKRLPSDKTIKSYEFNYKDPHFKDTSWSQNAILNSMVTEYGRGISGYGDFGRYVFQARLSSWGQFEIQKLSNYACSLIFKKYGYDVKLHGEFDRNSHEWGRGKKQVERIGKKYQWIAMYEIAARLADNYPLVTRETRWSENQKEETYSGPWEPFMRNIDPSYLWDNTIPCNIRKDAFSYAQWGEDSIAWTQTEEDFPDFTRFIEYIDENNIKWLLLGANFSWRSKLPLGQEDECLRQWLQYRFHSCFASDTDFELTWQWLQNNCNGAELVSPAQSYRIFLREYYWAPSYKFFEGSYYYGHEEWQFFEPLQTKNLDGPMLMPTTEYYLWEYEAKDHVSHAIPCKELVTFFNLTPGNHTGEWINPAGEVIYRDCQIEPSEKSCSLIRKDKLIDFLEQKHLKIIWSCLGDKSAYTSHYHYSDMPLPLEIAGTYILKNSKIEGVSRIIHREKR